MGASTKYCVTLKQDLQQRSLILIMPGTMTHEDCLLTAGVAGQRARVCHNVTLSLRNLAKVNVNMD